MIHRPRGHARTRCLVWSQQSPLEFFQYGSGRPCARVSRVLTKATSYLIALSLQPKEVGNDNRAEVKNDGFGSRAAVATTSAARPVYPRQPTTCCTAKVGSVGPIRDKSTGALGRRQPVPTHPELR